MDNFSKPMLVTNHQYRTSLYFPREIFPKYLITMYIDREDHITHFYKDLHKIEYLEISCPWYDMVQGVSYYFFSIRTPPGTVRTKHTYLPTPYTHAKCKTTKLVTFIIFIVAAISANTPLYLSVFCCRCVPPSCL